MTINYTTGYAGTGKSTKLLELLSTVPEDTTVVLAPTHKALERLRQEYDGNVELKTIHSLLGLIPTINEKAKHIDHIQAIMKLDNDIESYTNIIIDEAGMINEDHFLDLVVKLEEIEDTITLHCHAKCDRNHKNDREGEACPKCDHKIVSVGDHKITLDLYLDPYQLLPVKGYQLQTDPATTINLTTQYRSEAKDIVATYTRFVEYLQDISKDDLTTPYSENIIPFDITKFKRGDRLLAYTNKAVGDWNKAIAKQLGIKGYVGQEVQLGANETVVVNEFVTLKYRELLNAYQCGTLKLQNSKIDKRFLEHVLKALLNTKGIEFILGDGKLLPVIVGIGNAKVILKEAGEAAIKNRSKFTAVYALGRAYIMDYPFATTVHKAQGQEFDTVFIDKIDIQKSIRNNYFETYARLMYVSISRCKKTLYI